MALLFACRAKRVEPLSADPALAAAEVRDLVSTCAGVSRALDRLEATRLAGRALGGLVDDALAHARCDDLTRAVRGHGDAHRLARARLLDARPVEALAELAGDGSGIRLRRAEVLDRVGRPSDALAELDAVLAREPDEAGRSLRRLLEVSIAARGGRIGELDRLVAAAPIPEQPALAFRAVADTPRAALATLAREATAIELVASAATRIEELDGPAAALAARERLVTAEPDVAEHWDDVARSRIAAGHTADALAAWDRASAIAPAQPSFRVAPIRALVIAGEAATARGRAAELARQARAGADVELVVTASAGAAAAGDASLALALAREAAARRPGDGRLAFLVAQRLVEAGDRAAAVEAYAELLACGARGRAWHRHEVAGKLLELADDGDAARALVIERLAAPRACDPVDPEDLATYVEALRRPGGGATPSAR